jgi:hypothetical protein
MNENDPKTLVEAVSTRFSTVMRGVVGRRITYRQLCAIDDCGFMGAP